MGITHEVCLIVTDVLNDFESQRKADKLTIRPSTSLQATNELFGSLAVQAGWIAEKGSKSTAVDNAAQELRQGTMVTFDGGLIRVLAPEEVRWRSLDLLDTRLLRLYSR